MPQDILDIELKNVSKFFGDFTAVDHVSIQIKKGEFFSMLGPSGCGKTTTLRMIAGFEFPDEGEIYIAGENVQNQQPYERKTNMVFQSLALFPHMNVYDNIAYGPMIRKVPSNKIKSKVSEMLRLVRLEGYEKRRVSQLSGGQKQRIAIARALVNEPKVLLLDEPLGALDLKLRLQMQYELKRIQKELGNTFVYVTHDQGEALTMSDKIAVMNQGRIEQFGPPREIYEHPATKFVAGFIGDANLLSGVVKEPGEESAVIELTNGVCCKAYAPDFPVGEKITLLLRHERIQVTAVPPKGMENTVPATITDVFYVGSMVKYHMILPEEIKLMAQLVNTTGREIFAPGDHVTASWNCGDTTVFAE